MPIMRQVWDERWWEHATAEQIGLAWEITGGWARNGDPYARRTQQWLGERIKDRFGVQLETDPVDSQLIAEVLAAGGGRDGTAAEAAGEERTVSFVIRDAQSATTVARGTVSLDADDRRPIGVVAADRLQEFNASQADGTKAHGRYVIEAYDTRLEGGKRHFLLRDDQAASMREGYDQWAQRVLAGQESAPLDRVRDVLQVERRRLWKELEQLGQADPRVVAARETLVDEVAIREGKNPRAAQVRSGQHRSLDEHAAQVVEVTDRLSDIELRLARVQADLRHEDPALVTEAAVLPRDLDPDWWATATPEEVAGIWTHVDGWTDGQAKDGMRADLQKQILRHHRIDVSPGASFKTMSREIHRSQQRPAVNACCGSASSHPARPLVGHRCHQRGQRPLQRPQGPAAGRARGTEAWRLRRRP
jgi:hypothetical protein